MTKRPARAPHEGSIYKRGSDGRWVACLGWPNGERKYRYRKTRAAAVVALGELRTMREAGMPPPDDKLTLNDWLDRWQRERVSRHAASTQASYQRMVDIVRPTLGKEPLRTLSVRQVAVWLEDILEEGVPAPSAGLFLVVLRTALNDAMREDLILRNPASLVRAPRYRAKKGKPLSAAEATGLMQAVRSHRLHALIVLALTSALRAGEMLGLTWDAVHLDEAYLEVRQQLRRVKGQGLVLTEVVKTARSEAPIALTGIAVRALQRHRARLIEQRMAAGDIWRGPDNPVAPDALVFPTQRGMPMDPATAWRVWSDMLARAGIEHRRLHDSRHTTATLLRALGVAPEVVQQVLRHAHVTMQATYVHTDLSQQRRAAAALDELLGEVLG